MKETINETNEMWRQMRAEGKKRGEKFADAAALNLAALESAGKLVTEWHTDYHLRITNPMNSETIEFYPTRGTIVHKGARQARVGLAAALDILGVKQ